MFAAPRRTRTVSVKRCVLVACLLVLFFPPSTFFTSAAPVGEDRERMKQLVDAKTKGDTVEAKIWLAVVLYGGIPLVLLVVIGLVVFFIVRSRKDDDDSSSDDSDSSSDEDTKSKKKEGETSTSKKDDSGFQTAKELEPVAGQQPPPAPAGEVTGQPPPTSAAAGASQAQSVDGVSQEKPVEPGISVPPTTATTDPASSLTKPTVMGAGLDAAQPPPTDAGPGAVPPPAQPSSAPPPPVEAPPQPPSMRAPPSAPPDADHPPSDTGYEDMGPPLILTQMGGPNA